LRRQLDEVLQQLQANLLALLGMELRREEVLLPDRRRERFSVGRAGGNDGFVHRPRKKAVDEINVAAVRHAAEKGTLGPNDLDLVPADLGNLQSCLLGKANDFASEN